MAARPAWIGTLAALAAITTSMAVQIEGHLARGPQVSWGEGVATVYAEALAGASLREIGGVAADSTFCTLWRRRASARSGTSTNRIISAITRRICSPRRRESLKATPPVALPESLRARTASGFNQWYDGNELQTCGFAMQKGQHHTSDLIGQSKKLWKNYATHHRECREKGNIGKGDCKALVWECTRGESCGGFGDQLRGISTAMYLAVLSRRVLLLRWERFGSDVAKEWAPGAVDWSEGARKLACEGHVSALGADTVDPKEINEKHGCVTIHTNAHPRNMAWNGDVGRFFSDAVAPKYLVGCSFRYLFRPKASSPQPWRSLVGSGVPYLALHLRLGDGAFHSNISDKRGTRKDIDDALHCAENLQRDVFGRGAPKGKLVVVSDSAMGRDWAAKRAKELGWDALTTHTDPHHLDHGSGGTSELRGVLSDYLLLGASKGIMQHGVYCSGFPATAGQMGLLPRDHHWFLSHDKTKCMPLQDL